MENNNFDFLQAIYDKDNKPMANNPNPDGRNSTGTSPAIIIGRREIGKKCDDYKNQLATDIITYWRDKIDPDDTDKNKENIQADIDLFLKGKDIGAYQYLKSAKENTNSPYIEMILNHIDDVVKQYKEEAEEELKQDVIVTKDIPDPEDIPEKNKDIKDDIETKSFIDDLRKKTINTIVSQVTKIINDSKETNNMNFSINTNEKVNMIEECINWMTESALRDGKEFKLNDDILELAIRECVMHEFDVLFKFESSNNDQFVKKIRNNKASILNESSMRKYGIIE